MPHGFRSSFRDWAAERTDAPREVCELALAHVNTNAVEAVYRRNDRLERRRELMGAMGGVPDRIRCFATFRRAPGSRVNCALDLALDPTAMATAGPSGGRGAPGRVTMRSGPGTAAPDPPAQARAAQGRRHLSKFTAIPRQVRIEWAYCGRWRHRVAPSRTLSVPLALR